MYLRNRFDKKSHFILSNVDKREKVFVFIRHAESIGNCENITREEKQKYAKCGFDYPLSLKGIENAKIAKKYFEQLINQKFKLYASNTIRAQETAKLLFDDSMVIVDNRLNEQDFSKFKEKDLLHPELHLFEKAKKNGFIDLEDPFYVYDETMETPVSVQKRIFSFINEKMLEQENVIVSISHAGTIKCIKGLLYDELPDRKFQHDLLSPKNLEYITFSYTELLQQIEKKNAGKYLYDEKDLLLN